MKVLIVLTSHDQLGDTGEKTGFWLEEFAAPYYTLRDAGAELTLTSPAGGQPPLDPKSDAPEAQTEATRKFHQDPDAQAQLANTVKLADVSADDFDAVFYPGGHGPLWDLTDNPESIALIEAFVRDGKPVAAVCHAPTALTNARRPDGSSLVAGKNVTGFANSEEDAVGLSDVVPFLLENRLRERGGNYRKTGDFVPYVVVDGTLVTGQNPASSAPAARELIGLLRSGGGFDPATRQRLTRELAELREQRRDLAVDLVDEQPTGDSGDQSQRLERADDLARIDKRSAELTDLLAERGTSTTVAPNRLPDGTEVTLRFASGTVKDFRVVLVTEEAGDREQDRVLTVDSPLGRALANRRVGDTVTFCTPEGESTAHVLALRPPSADRREARGG